jgi:hypothetical protein
VGGDDRPPPPELLAFLDAFGEEVVEIVLGLRQRVLAVVPNANEVVWDATNAVSLVFTPSPRWQDGICHIAVYSKHANLGFNKGANLPDPLGILSGGGTLIRHVTFTSVEDVTAEWIDDYLRAALTQDDLTDQMGDGTTTVRVSKGAKRRPR